MKPRSRFTTTLIMAATLLLLIAYLVVVELPREDKRKQAEETADLLFNFKSTDVTTVALRYPEGGIELKKAPDGLWRITRPLQTEADQREVQSLISTVADIRFTRVVEEAAVQPSEFGLEHPVVDVALTLPDRTERLLLGDDGPMPSTLYVKKEGDPRVVLTPQWIKGSLTRTVFDFRIKVILPFETEKTDQVMLEFQKKNLLLVKEDQHWYLKKPTDEPADEDAILSLSRMLQNLRATFFIDPGPEYDSTMKHLRKPLVVATVREAGDGGPKTLTAKFYDAPEKDSVYLVTDPDKPIYRVARVNLDELKPDLFHYQAKHLLRNQWDEVKEISFNLPEESFKIKRNGNAWLMDGDEQAVNPDRVNRMIDQFEKLKAVQSTEQPVKDPSTVGLKPAAYEIRFADPAKKITATLQIGIELKGMMYARGNTRIGIVLINKDFLDEIPKKAELLKKEEPVKEKEQNQIE